MVSCYPTGGRSPLRRQLFNEILHMTPFSELIQSDTPVLVDFHADWCGPCRTMAPVISEVAKAVQGKGRVIKIDIDKNPEAARNYNVQAVPTFMIFKNGSVIWRHSGTIDKGSLLRVMNQNS